jgi:DNA modification methylase
LVENCILLTTEDNDLVLDPFLGSGTSGIVSKKLNRTFIGIEIDEKYLNLSKNLLEVHTEK